MGPVPQICPLGVWQELKHLRCQNFTAWESWQLEKASDQFMLLVGCTKLRSSKKTFLLDCYMLRNSILHDINMAFLSNDSKEMTPEGFENVLIQKLGLSESMDGD